MHSTGRNQVIGENLKQMGHGNENPRKLCFIDGKILEVFYICESVGSNSKPFRKYIPSLNKFLMLIEKPGVSLKRVRFLQLRASVIENFTL